MEVILTEAEQEAASWLDWDDATIGKAVRALAHVWVGDDPNRILAHRAAALFLCAGCHEVNAETTTLTLNGVTFGGEPVGHYRVTVERSAEPYDLGDAEPAAEWDGDKLTQVSFTLAEDTVRVPDLTAPRRPWWKFGRGR